MRAKAAAEVRFPRLVPPFRPQRSPGHYATTEGIVRATAKRTSVATLSVTHIFLFKCEFRSQVNSFYKRLDV
ncbi:hypothetical protein KDI_13760 [Dictyobacter arantiisoli]|uniref:Uncharacterized protein n=1 Tax=Dictyobacter arantiisoli TaxID=2014874 RepID=A0A5A5T8S0_9CHLR|nr:hypothetical protein KDI_13760 [Dictyobacter arantiisoli]